MMELSFLFSAGCMIFGIIAERCEAYGPTCILFWISGLLFGWGTWLAVKSLGV